MLTRAGEEQGASVEGGGDKLAQPMESSVKTQKQNTTPRPSTVPTHTKELKLSKLRGHCTPCSLPHYHNSQGMEATNSSPSLHVTTCHWLPTTDSEVGSDPAFSTRSDVYFYCVIYMARNQKLWYWYNNTNTVLINLHGLAHETQLVKPHCTEHVGDHYFQCPVPQTHLSAGPRANDTWRRKRNRKGQHWLSLLTGHPQWCSSADCVTVYSADSMRTDWVWY